MSDGTISARLQVFGERPGPRINPAIHGQFAEHLGNCIEGGLWVGEESSIPNTRGIRDDVVGALKALQVPVLRWPGGCFADEYCWRDGIGPRASRPRRINTHWGGVIETNQFGTHEFMDLCERIGAEPYVAGNLGSATPREMLEWVEYLTCDQPSTLVELRRQNGRKEPWRVPYFGVGNESWGCGGSMRAEFYADQFRRYATYVKSYSGNQIARIACGPGGEDYGWTEVLMAQARSQMEGLSLHWYSLPTGRWEKKGSATNFGEAEWHSTLARAARIEEVVAKNAAIMDRHDPERRVGLVVDEWGTWYDADPGTPPGFLRQQSTLRDALVAAVTLSALHAHAARVTMANVAQMVNVLQAMILTDGERMLLTPSYHAFDLYKQHQGGLSVPLEHDAPDYALGGESVRCLHGSASRDAAGALHVTLSNLDPRRELELVVSGLSGPIRGSVLTASSMNAHNTFSNPDVVAVRPFTGFRTDAAATRVVLPPMSLVLLSAT